MKAYLFDKGVYASPTVYGCSGGDECDSYRMFYIAIPELKIIINPTEYSEEKTRLYFQNHTDFIDFENDPRATPFDFPNELALDIAEKIRADKRLTDAHRFIRKIFTDAVAKDERKSHESS